MLLPKQLYRGDDDRLNERFLRSTSHFHQFHTNLINGGVGNTIFSQALIELINKHILSSFPKSHFLSFTDDKVAALRYGLNLFEADQEVIDLCCCEYLNDDTNWDFALITLETDLLEVVNIPTPGIYECHYKPILSEFSKYEYYKIFLIDSSCALKHANSSTFKTAIEYSHFDNEWLLLPATPKVFNYAKVEYSAILDGGCFSENKYYQINHETREKCNIISY